MVNTEGQLHQAEHTTPKSRTEYEYPAGPGEEERFLRPFAVDAGLRGPTTPAGADRDDTLDLLSLVVAARTPGTHEWLRPEREAILTHAGRPCTVTDLAAEVRLPLEQVRVIVTDMLVDGSLQRCGPSRYLGREDVLHAVLAGLQAL
ncbi:MAG TPA: DUF742 domain-containing protein [Candidatus Nocardiopsis merdipullorum]|nr:DUF742 domain-containing protein [Candidatus Nocardiopsis merdipullorum]